MITTRQASVNIFFDTYNRKPNNSSGTRCGRATALTYRANEDLTSARTPLKEEKIWRREPDAEGQRLGICAILHEIVGEFISSVLWGGPPLYGRPSVWSVETELVWNATRAFVLCLFGVNEHADSRKLLPTIKQGQTNVKYLSQFCHIAVVRPLFFSFVQTEQKNGTGLSGQLTPNDLLLH